MLLASEPKTIGHMPWTIWALHISCFQCIILEISCLQAFIGALHISCFQCIILEISCLQAFIDKITLSSAHYALMKFNILIPLKMHILHVANNMITINMKQNRHAVDKLKRFQDFYIRPCLFINRHKK